MDYTTSIIDRGESEALVFYHAFPLNAAQWRPQIDFFQEQYRVVAINLQDLVEPGATFATLAERCVGTLAQMGIKHFVQIGCSMGGYLAMAVLRDFPDVVAGTVFANTRAGADTDAVRETRLRQIDTIRQSGTASILDGMLPKLIGATTAAKSPDVAVHIRSLSEQMTPTAMAGFLQAMAGRPDSTELLATHAGPVCVIAGAEDALIPSEALLELHSLCIGSEYHIIPEAGHLTNIEAPVLFNDVVQRFLLKICYGV